MMQHTTIQNTISIAPIGLSFPRLSYFQNNILATPFYMKPYPKHTCHFIDWGSKDSISCNPVSYDILILWLYHVINITNSGQFHYCDVTMTAMASQITCLAIVYSTVYSDADQRKHQSSASLAFVRGIHRGPVNSPHKWPVTRKMFPFDDVIMSVIYIPL